MAQTPDEETRHRPHFIGYNISGGLSVTPYSGALGRSFAPRFGVLQFGLSLSYRRHALWALMSLGLSDTRSKTVSVYDSFPSHKQVRAPEFALVEQYMLANNSMRQWSLLGGFSWISFFGDSVYAYRTAPYIVYGSACAGLAVDLKFGSDPAEYGNRYEEVGFSALRVSYLVQVPVLGKPRISGAAHMLSLAFIYSEQLIHVNRPRPDPDAYKNRSMTHHYYPRTFWNQWGRGKEDRVFVYD